MNPYLYLPRNRAERRASARDGLAFGYSPEEVAFSTGLKLRTVERINRGFFGPLDRQLAVYRLAYRAEYVRFRDAYSASRGMLAFTVAPVFGAPYVKESVTKTKGEA